MDGKTKRMEKPPTASSGVKELIHIAAMASVTLLVIMILPTTALFAYSETMNQPESIGFTKAHQILDSLPKKKGETTTLASGVKVRRIDAIRKNELPELIEMGGVSAKWEFVKGDKSYKMYITFDNVPKAALYAILHPDAINHFVDIYGNDRDNAWMIEEAETGGIKAIKHNLPNLPDSDFEK